MQQIVRRSPIRVHPDPDYNNLSRDLMNKTNRYDIAYALNLAQTKWREMTNGYADTTQIESYTQSGGNVMGMFN